MKMLLAGPGTGKTTRIKEIVGAYEGRSFLILSFTNATVTDLLDSLATGKTGISKRNCMTLHAYALRIVGHSNECVLDDFEETIAAKRAEKFQMSLNDFCRAFDCITFDQMIEKATSFIRDNEVAVEELIDQDTIFMVDEYQDFNQLERELIQQISARVNETYILGDDDQCIYEFKNAGIEGIQSLYDDRTVEKLENENTCFRCPDDIAIACDNLIQHNQRRVPKELKPSGKAGHLDIRQYDTQEQTGRAVLDEARRIRAVDQNSSIMILSSNKFALDPIIEAFDIGGFSYTNLLRLAVDQDQRSLVWEIRCLLSSNSKHKILYLLLIGGTRKVGFDVQRETLATSIEKAWQGIVDAAKKKTDLSPRFLELLDTSVSLNDLRGEPRYSAIFSTMPGCEDMDVDQVVDQLNANLSRVPEFDQHGVNLLTIHKSKGLQADYVFVVGVVEGMLPNATVGINDIENQRRLLYVGMSRALRGLYLVSTVKWDGAIIHKFDKSKFTYDWRSRTYVGAASSFVSELRGQS